MTQSITKRTEKIIAMRTNGASYAEIAREVSVSNNTVYQTLARAGLISKSKGRKLSTEQRQEIIDLRTTDPREWTYMALAIKFDVQPPTINKILRSAGLVKTKSA
jgi:transposase